MSFRNTGWVSWQLALVGHLNLLDPTAILAAAESELPYGSLINLTKTRVDVASSMTFAVQCGHDAIGVCL